MPGEEGTKVKGNQKDKKRKGAEVTNPLLAVMAQVPKASGKRNKKGASHTHAANMKGASHTHASEGMKSTSSSLLILGGNKEGASNTPAPDLTMSGKIKLTFSVPFEMYNENVNKILYIEGSDMPM